MKLVSVESFAKKKEIVVLPLFLKF